VEIDGASIEANGERLDFVVKIAGRVPQQTPAGAGFRVSFQLVTQDERRIHLDAEASADGWVASAAGGPQPGFPGELRFQPRSVVISIDRSYVGVAPFDWLASVAYTKGSSYGFDTLPEDGFARYP
jgi:hypothetical protein